MLQRASIAAVIIYTFHIEFDAETPYELNKILSEADDDASEEGLDDLQQELDNDVDPLEAVKNTSESTQNPDDRIPSDTEECEGFAKAVNSKLPFVSIIESDALGTGQTTTISSSTALHVWLTDGTYHYDAEVPLGITNPEHLPVFQRN